MANAAPPDSPQRYTLSALSSPYFSKMYTYASTQSSTCCSMVTSLPFTNRNSNAMPSIPVCRQIGDKTCKEKSQRPTKKPPPWIYKMTPLELSQPGYLNSYAFTLLLALMTCLNGSG
eukprot:CAMPEP_0197043476 /NCGR_PEP_ID=MMETSP1384-20130603/19725_1 /TAXON_ID=29189 /ORGANISM="Ammonia sp." /LENGTH=116 /DNA_ID=CAMNT_0042474783 /DNA_START=20 /DNA_END=370 /DNA_ORIENTATION=-